jgi:hypothetical protein
MGLEAIVFRRSENKNNAPTILTVLTRRLLCRGGDGDGLILSASRSRGRAVALPLMAALKVSLYPSLPETGGCARRNLANGSENGRLPQEGASRPKRFAAAPS